MTVIAPAKTVTPNLVIAPTNKKEPTAVFAREVRVVGLFVNAPSARVTKIVLRSPTQSTVMAPPHSVWNAKKSPIVPTPSYRSAHLLQQRVWLVSKTPIVQAEPPVTPSRKPATKTAKVH